MNKHEIEKILLDLNLPNSEYCILGSASLVMRGIKKEASDLDIAITKKGLKTLKKRFLVKEKNCCFHLLNGGFQIEMLIRKQEDMKIEYYLGYPLQNINQLLENKIKRNLSKDKVDINLLKSIIKKPDEYLSLYDEKGILTNDIIRRSSKYILPKNRYIMTTIIFIMNDSKQLLIQETSFLRGNEYATTGGHVKSDSNSLKTIQEEIQEELGLIVDDKDFVYLGKEHLSYKFQDIYFLIRNVNLKDLRLQDDEVKCVKWLSLAEIDCLIQQGLFRKSNIYGYQLLKEYLKLKN